VRINCDVETRAKFNLSDERALLADKLGIWHLRVLRHNHDMEVISQPKL